MYSKLAYVKYSIVTRVMKALLFRTKTYVYIVRIDNYIDIKLIEKTEFQAIVICY